MNFPKYLSVAFASMFKFAIGPTLGFSLKLGFVATFISTIIGMMLSVFLFALLGKYINEKLIKKLYPNRKLFTKRNRKIVKIWAKYGLTGIAFLTPLFLTPVGGTLVATSFGEHRNKILFYMLLSGLFWDLIVVTVIYFLGGISKY